MMILAKSLSGHNLKGDHWNAPDFGMRKLLNGVHVCAKFHENWKESGFFVDLAWNDWHRAGIKEGILAILQLRKC